MTTNNPYFKLFPLNNARTGFKPYAMPVVYIERHRLTSDGTAIGDSATQKIRYYIVDAPDTARVAGPFNSDLRVPNISLYEIDLNEKDLLDRKIAVDHFQFYRKSIDSSGTVTYNSIDFSEAIEGDYFDYTLNSNNVSDKIEYFPDAYYYDLSNIPISVDGLPKPKRYFFVWEATFFSRISTANGNLKCIGTSLGLTNKSLEVNHPGEVHYLMLKSTPALYFNYEGFNEENDPTLEFYRPFADLLQDIFDEQKILDGVNHIDSVPAAFIPYLAYLIGWDLPNYPGVSDNLRRQILRRAVHLQKLKGSKRVINELFEMFGFTVNILNLWANKQGDKLLGINDGLDSQHVVQLDQLLSNYDATGFSAGTIPLTFIPDKNVQVAVYAYQVKAGTDDYQKLIDFSNNLSSNLEYYNDTTVRYDINGVVITKSLDDLNSSFTNGLIGATKVIIDESDYQIYGRKIINSVNVSFNKNENTIFLNYDHELSVDGGKLFVFVVYERTKIVVSNDIINTRSSRFDVEILRRSDNSPVDYNLLMYMLSFIFKLKAFHSLLRKIKYTLDIYEVYNVTDFCLSAIDLLKSGTSLGDLQVPPAIIPTDDSSCESTDRNFKQSDIDLKKIVLAGLEEEFQAWKRQTTKTSDGTIGGDCTLNKEGQDKVLPTNVDYDQTVDDRPTYCEDLPTKPDFCYKGRSKDEITISTEVVLKETYLNVPCDPKLGYGTYWEESSQVNFDHQNSGFLKSRLIAVDNKFKTLHYNAKPYFDPKIDTSQNTLSLSPASLEIEKEHLGFPSHRFLSIAYLLNDYNYTSSNYSYGYDIVRERPWDIDTICGTYNDRLNAKLTGTGNKSARIHFNGTSFDVVETFTGLIISKGFSTYDNALIYVNDNDLFIGQELTWDNNDLIYIGNGIESEMNLDDHTIVTGDDRLITHNVYQNTISSEYVQDDFTITSLSKISTLNDYGPIFNSACSENNEDYIGGYASETNIISISGNYRYDSPDPNGLIDRPSIAAGLGIPLGTLQTSARFFGQSMVYVDKSNSEEYNRVKPYRLDCNCLVNDCGNLTGTSTTSDVQCQSESLFDSEGNLDPSPDKIEFDFTALLIEKISTCTRLTNHDINNLFCINEECTLPNSGSFRYKDDYEVIYEVSWVTVDSLLDLICVTKDPKIPGVDPTGYVENGAVFRKGIITTVRQIFRESTVEAEGVEQSVGYYQSNVKCGDIKFEDPFTYGIDCAMQDDLEIEVSDGPMWMDPSEVGPEETTFIDLDAGTWKTKGTVWADVELDSGGNVVYPTQNPQIWIDFTTPDDSDIVVQFSSSSVSMSYSSYSSDSDSISSDSSQVSEQSSDSSLSLLSPSSNSSQSSSSSTSSSDSSQSSLSSSSSTSSSDSSQSSSSSTSSSDSSQSSSSSTSSSDSSQSSLSTPSSNSSLSTNSSDSSSSSLSTPSSDSSSLSSLSILSSDSSLSSMSSDSSNSSQSSSSTSGSSNSSRSSDSSHSSQSGNSLSLSSNSSESTISLSSESSSSSSSKSLSSLSSNSSNSSSSSSKSLSSLSSNSSSSSSKSLSSLSSNSSSSSSTSQSTLSLSSASILSISTDSSGSSDSSISMSSMSTGSVESGSVSSSTSSLNDGIGEMQLGPDGHPEFIVRA